MSATDLDRVIGWTITDDDAPRKPSVVTRIERDTDSLYFHTLAGWSFGGKREYLGISDRGSRVVVSVSGLLCATLTPPTEAV